MPQFPITKNGADRLREDLRRLKLEERLRIVQAIAEARAHGDLSENAEYAAARERQSFIEGRIKDLEHKLAHAHVIDPGKLQLDGRCVFGATVDLMEQEQGQKITYQIVGDDEADLQQGKISVSSPVARALIGKYAGDVVAVAVPGGQKEYEVLGVRYE